MNVGSIGCSFIHSSAHCGMLINWLCYCRCGLPGGRKEVLAFWRMYPSSLGEQLCPPHPHHDTLLHHCLEQWNQVTGTKTSGRRHAFPLCIVSVRCANYNINLSLHTYIMAKPYSTDTTKCWQGSGEMGTLTHAWGEWIINNIATLQDRLVLSDKSWYILNHVIFYHIPWYLVKWDTISFPLNT